MKAFEEVSRKWWESFDNVCALARWMIDAGNVGGEDPDEAMKNLCSYFEKPWKWETEWNDYQEDVKFQDRKRESTRGLLETLQRIQ